MIKRIFSLILAFVLCFGTNIYCSASVDMQYQKTNIKLGDVNADGEINVNDCLNLINVLINAKNAYMLYERADVNADYTCDVTDLLFLRKYIAELDVNFIDADFFRNVGDVTEELEDLGRNNFDTSYVDWNDSSVETTVARNPNDMIAYKSKVYVAGGNYNTNQGPVRVTYYARDYNTGKSAGTIDTEQINRFYIYDDIVFTTSIDERNWGSASVCYLSDYRFAFQSKSGVLAKNIHCYDMEKYNDTFFFAGSAVHYDDKYLGYSGSKLELAKAVVHMFKGDDITKCTSSDFVDVPLINKHGKVIDYDSDLVEATKSNGDKYYYDNRGVARIYDLFIWDDELYALYYDQYIYSRDEKYNYNGLYKFDKQNQQFVYDENLNIDFLVSCFESSQDRNKILHDFEWGDKYFFITDRGLSSTSDFVNYKQESIPQVEYATVRDVIFRDDSAYVICSEVNSKGGFTNYLFETTDFKNYNQILQFDALSYVRSFEYCNGAFYFGLGATVEGDYCNTECGRMYRYIYYK